MPKRLLLSSIVSLASIVFLLLTLVKGEPDHIEVGFTQPGGEKGKIVLEIPRQVWVGDEYLIPVRVDMQPFQDSALPITLIGKLESNAEEVLPRGELRLGLNSNHPVTLEWRVRTMRKMLYPGMLWIWMENESGKQLVLAREFVLDARNIFGLRMITLRIILGQIIFLSFVVVFYSLVMYKKGNKKT